MSLSIIENKYYIISLIILVSLHLPLTSCAQKGSVNINAGFKLHHSSNYELKKINQRVTKVEQLILTAGADYYISNTFFLGPQVSYEKNESHLYKDILTSANTGIGLTVGRKFFISPKFSFISRLTIMHEEGESTNTSTFSYGVFDVVSKDFYHLVSTNISLSPELIYMPLKNLGVFLRLSGLYFENTKDKGGSEEDKKEFTLDLRPINSHVGLIYSFRLL